MKKKVFNVAAALAEQEFLSAVQTMVLSTGDNPAREGLRETPQRVQRAYAEWFSGYAADPAALFKVFEDGADSCDEMVSVCNLRVFSHCEHHMTPFFGLAHIAYIPRGKLLGLSKFARLVEVFARRLQVQERLTNQLADTLVQFLEPVGVGVVLECRHLCMESRGARSQGAITTTSALRGAMRTIDSARAEFLALVNSASRAREGV